MPSTVEHRPPKNLPHPTGLPMRTIYAYKKCSTCRKATKL